MVAQQEFRSNRLSKDMQIHGVQLLLPVITDIDQSKCFVLSLDQGSWPGNRWYFLGEYNTHFISFY